MTNRMKGPQHFGNELRKSFVDEGDHPSPGPAAHNIKTLNKNNPPYWSLGKSQQRDSFLDKYHRAVPSPDKYQANFETIQPSHPSFTIPLFKEPSNPDKIDTENTLNYNPNIDNSKYKKIHYSFSHRYDRDFSTISPAPNTQRPEKRDKQSHNIAQRSFSIGQRPQPYGQEGRYPHAAKYHISQDIGGQKHLIGKSQRPVISIGESPGKFYQISGNLYDNIKGKSLGKFIPIPKNPDLTNFPAANAYIPLFPKQNRSIINYNSNRSQIINLTTINNPSPNKYQTNLQKSQKTISFTQGQKQMPDHTVIPGVGTYKIQSKLDKILGTMGIRHKKLKQFVNPCASNYDPKQTLIRPRSKSPINFQSERVDFSKSITGRVGPGDYSILQKELLQSGKMSKSSKFEPQRNRNPGPGSYEIHTGIGNLPKYSCPTKKLTQFGFSTIQMKKRERVKLIKEPQAIKNDSVSLSVSEQLQNK